MTSAAIQTCEGKNRGASWGRNRGLPVGPAAASECTRRTAGWGPTAACGVSAGFGRTRSGWERSEAELPGAERTGRGNLGKVAELGYKVVEPRSSRAAIKKRSL